MKGKGKGDRSSGKGASTPGKGATTPSKSASTPTASKGSASTSAGDKDDLSECPLSFPDLAPVDAARLCPRYSAILARGSASEAGTVGMEELDTLQTDLETLLASVAKRMRLLEQEVQVLNNWQEGKITGPVLDSTPKGKGSGKGSGESSTKRAGGKSVDKPPAKKFKESSGKGSGSLVKGTPKGKVQQVKLQEYEFPESPATKPVDVPKLKTDAPNRFWALVEPYVGDITTDSLKVLEDLIRTHEDEDTEFYRVPALGRHYADKWAAEDTGEEQLQSGVSLGDKFTACSNAAELSAGLRREVSAGVDETSPFGPLTQRLVQALIEENIMTPLDGTDATDGADADTAAEAAAISPRSLAKQLNIGNTAALERRIRKELEENGLLDDDSMDGTAAPAPAAVADGGENPAAPVAPPSNGEDDEIVAELRKKQQELRALSQHNLMVTRRLYRRAKEEMAYQDLRKKVTSADNEVMEAYRKIQATRAKKKTPTKKELEAARKVLREREALVRQLESHTQSHNT